MKTFSDEDRSVRFIARGAAARLHAWGAIAPLLRSEDSRASEQAWLAFTYTFDVAGVEKLAALAGDAQAGIRAHTADALGHLAYLPKPYDRKALLAAVELLAA